MNKLSDIEIQLFEKYVVANNFTDFSEAHFYNALSDIVPTWRLEQIAGQNRMYELVETTAYIDYINQLINDQKSKML